MELGAGIRGGRWGGRKWRYLVLDAVLLRLVKFVIIIVVVVVVKAGDRFCLDIWLASLHNLLFLLVVN